MGRGRVLGGSTGLRLGRLCKSRLQPLRTPGRWHTDAKVLGGLGGRGQGRSRSLGRLWGGAHVSVQHILIYPLECSYLLCQILLFGVC